MLVIKENKIKTKLIHILTVFFENDNTKFNNVVVEAIKLILLNYNMMVK